MRTSLLRLLALVPALAAGASPTQKPAPRKEVPSLGLGDFGKPIPKGDGVSGREASKLGPESSVKARPDAKYDVVAVHHAKAYTPSSNGPLRNGPELTQVALRGFPPATEAFSTLIKVRSVSRQGAPIDIVVLDPRGDTAMSATGELRFTGKDKDTVSYTVDWESTPARSPGEFSVLVRVAGKPLGTWPLKVVSAAK